MLQTSLSVVIPGTSNQALLSVSGRRTLCTFIYAARNSKRFKTSSAYSFRGKTLMNPERSAKPFLDFNLH